MEMRPSVVITHWVHKEVIDFLSPHFRVIQNPTRETWSRTRVLAQAREAFGLMVFMPDTIDDDFLSRCPRLKIVAAALKGYDNFDIGACTRRGVWFTIVPDLLTNATAELTVGLMIGLGRRMLEGDRFVRSGRFVGWRPVLYGCGLSGHTVGIVGMGSVGRAVARRLQGFDARLVYADPSPLGEREEAALGATRATMNELLSASDFVVICLPLTPDTFHLIDARAITSMKPGSYLINTGRGSAIEEPAVAAALKSGHLRGYAADVFEMEDWVRSDRPLSISPSIIDMPDRTFLTPHIGSAVDDLRREIAMEAASNLVQALNSERPAGAINEPAFVTAGIPLPGGGEVQAEYSKSRA